jgi:N-acetylmuramoyl-L-alanine amidase
MHTTAAGMRRRVAACASLAVLLAGCAGRTPVLPGPTPPPPRPVHERPAPGYVARLDSLPPADPTLLAGRRIVLDPGHGGFFKGSIGVHGLTEAEVNLGVALDLDSLLRARGAEVLMTRRTDRDYLEPADSSLKHDLAVRVKMANAFRPDLFLSIHHNADPGGAHDVNETQTYYQLGDDGPSYDAGADVHRALVRNLGIAGQRLLPGNFAVVRGSEAPALLTEASYLTNPDVEAKLATPQARELEAEALLIGVTRYLTRRAPVIERLAIESADPPPAAIALGRPLLSARVRGAFDTAALRLDGEGLAPLRLGDSLVATPEHPLAAGEHTVSISVRLAGEGSSRTVRRTFRVEKRLAHLLVDFPGQPRAAIRGLIGVRVQALDEDGLPLTADTLVVRVRARNAAPADTVLLVRDGVAWGYFRHVPARHAAKSAGAHFVVSARASAHAAPSVTADLEVTAAAGVRTGFALAMPGGGALQLAPALRARVPQAWIDRDGFVALPAAGGTPRLPGFRAWGADSAWPPRFVAIAGGAFTGRRVVLDPEGGGDDAGGTGPSGTRAATLNLEVARALAAMLEAAGAEVLLTREGDAAVSDVERVQRGEAFGPDRYLRIGHAAAPPLAGHYFSSVGGRRWGQRLAAVCAQLGLADSLPVAEVAKYTITQTSATALYASLARIDDAASEARLLAAGTLRAEAYALYLALAGDLAGGAAPAIETVTVHDGGGTPLPGALVTAGNAFVLQADREGRVRFARTEPGPIELEVQDPRASPRTLLIDSSSSRIPKGRR